MQEQENSVLKSMKLKVVVLENFPLWSENGQSCKKIICTKLAFFFAMVQKWSEL